MKTVKPSFDRQKAFNIMKAHMLTQRQRCVLESPETIEGMLEYNVKIQARCAYRGANNLRCPIGELISDIAYDESLEGLTVLDWPVIRALEVSGWGIITDEDADFLREMQAVHDNEEPEFWEEELIIVADSHLLKYE